MFRERFNRYDGIVSLLPLPLSPLGSLPLASKRGGLSCLYPPMELETDKSLALLVSEAGVVHNVLVLASEVNLITLLYPAYGEDVVVAEGGDYPQMFRGKTYLFGASCSVGAISFGGRGEGALRSDQGG